jgi:cytochrome P450
MSLVDAVDVPFLRLSEPSFSIRSPEVREARKRSWYARTPYGIAVLRYEDVGKLLRDPRLRQGSHAWPAHNNVTGTFTDWWLRIVLNRVGDDHARLRRLANPAFSPKPIIALQPKFAELADELIDKFAGRGRCEFMAEFSEPYVTRVICILLGFDQSEWRRLADIAADMGLALGVTFKQDVEKIDKATAALFDYAHGVIEECRTRPLGDDFVSLLLQANEEKDRLSDQELHDMVVLAVFGGIDTTRNQLGLAMSRIRGNRPAAICARLRHYCAAQTAFRVWRRAASLSRSFHCARRHDGGAQGIGEAHQKSAARRRADLAAGQREYRPHQAPHCIRPRILNAACEVDCRTGEPTL